MDTIKVLFVCIHNSGRSQMAEALLNKYGQGRFSAESAGLEPGNLNPIVVQALSDIDIDISKNNTKSVFDIFRKGKRFNYVITVCDETSAEKCPVFPGLTKRLHWSFQDPAALPGTPEEKLAKTKVIRDQMRKKIEDFVQQA